MSIDLSRCVDQYLESRNLSASSRKEYGGTLRKWKRWGGELPLEQLTRREIRSFLDWVFQDAIQTGGANPGRTANKAREHVAAVISWAWEQDLLETMPRFPRPREQRDVAGRYYLTKAEINALYFGTFSMRRPRGWTQELPVGRYWRCALVMFFNYGVDTGTIWSYSPVHEPLRWRHVSWEHRSPDGQVKERCPSAGCSIGG